MIETGKLHISECIMSEMKNNKNFCDDVCIAYAAHKHGFWTNSENYTQSKHNKAICAIFPTVTGDIQIITSADRTHTEIRKAR